jgi:uncharacterized membrane protein YheB (UPF0754 family)
LFPVSAVILPFGGALIGWFTNWLAVRFLFRPHRPVHILFTKYSFQGMLPKYRFELAKSIGNLIKKDLLPVDSLIGYLRSDEVNAELVHLTMLTVRAKILDKLPVFLPSSVKKRLSDIIAVQIQKELPSLLKELANRYKEKLEGEFTLASIIENKLNTLNLEQLEAIVVQIAGRELRHIEIIGGILGFLIGLCQVGLMFIFS